MSVTLEEEVERIITGSITPIRSTSPSSVTLVRLSLTFNIVKVARVEYLSANAYIHTYIHTYIYRYIHT